MSHPWATGWRLAVTRTLPVIVFVAATLLAQAAERRTERILFIGNSLTYVNDLPRTVREVVAQGTNVTVHTETVAFPDFSLEDHWNDGRARRALQSGRWTVVVMQQGPSAGADGRRVLREFAGRFAGVAKQRGARVALYTVWPSRARLGDIDAVIESHQLAAHDAGGEVVPVGVAWRDVLAADASAPLYADDGFHPSRAGTYLAALVFRAWLTREPVAGVTKDWRGATRLGLKPAGVQLLEAAANRATGLAVVSAPVR